MANLNKGLLTKLAAAYAEGKIDMTPMDFARSIIFVIGYHVKHKTPQVNDLKKLYGSAGSTSLKDQASYYSRSLYPDVMVKNAKAVRVFWKLFNTMNSSLIQESIQESFNESYGQVA